MNDFWHWWQHIPQQLDPVIFEIGGFKLQYYGLMYVVAFVVTYLLVTYRINHEERFQLTPDQVQALITSMMLGVIVGGRIGYVIFYNLPYYLKHPLEIILPFDISNGFKFTGITGMSFHGGLICVILFTWLYCHKNGLNLFEVADLFIPAIPLGYTFGRIGNFINGELYGRVTSAPIGMVFPLAPGSQLRHPSQLYEALLEAPRAVLEQSTDERLRLIGSDYILGNWPGFNGADTVPVDDRLRSISAGLSSPSTENCHKLPLMRAFFQ